MKRRIYGKSKLMLAAGYRERHAHLQDIHSAALPEYVGFHLSKDYHGCQTSNSDEENLHAAG
jgi:hypothetical protein|uniref:Uncharacterized protein n=1 Tax=Picea glauca TaxID=3330 RepID=A0A101LZH9_PICGL|nr:hypothetical protein ABT39_MTgene5202 [Picea glauca]QHR91181.1 hypothetical protein Q903MT_gene5213 [Picea sitchensis]